MKLNKWTVGLTAAGVVSLGSVAMAEEKPMSSVGTLVSGTELSGYVDTSAMWKPGNGNQYLPGRFNDGASKVDGFNLNVVGLTLQKAPGDDNWAAGYRADLLYGPDAVGWNPSANGAQNSDFAIKQAYVDLVLPVGTGWDFKMGTFNTVVGYESFESYVNPNYGRSYGFNLEPTAHTGLLTSYKFSEAFSANAGIANTYSTGINTRNTMRADGSTIDSAKTYMASLTVGAPESMGFLSGSSLSAGFVNGFGGDPTHNSSLFYVGSTIKTGVEGLAVGAAFDYRKNGLNTITTAENENWAWAAAGYVTYAMTEHMKVAGRLDYTAGTDGTFYDSGADGLINHQNKLLSVTGTLDYSLWANVISRLELRWDHCTNGKAYGGEGFVSDGEGGTISTGPDQENAFTVAANLVYVF